jgi:hypothetical protein
MDLSSIDKTVRRGYLQSHSGFETSTIVPFTYAPFQQGLPYFGALSLHRAA